jgi:endonuclease G
MMAKPVSSTTRLILILLVVAGTILWRMYGSESKTQSPTTTSHTKKTHTPHVPRNAGEGPDYLNHVELGKPTGDNGFIIERKQYVLSYNRDRGGPNWVCWNLNATHYGYTPRSAGFVPDTDLPSNYTRITTNDYRGSGYDRGHMVRSEDRTFNADENSMTFIMSNVLPQTHDLNAGPWLRLEDFSQQLAQKENKELYIVAGGIFDANPEMIKSRVAVPKSTWKIVVVLERGQGAADVTSSTEVIAVNMPNVTGIIHDDWRPYKTTVAEIERLTGYSFFSALPADVQRALKNKTTSL